MVGIRTVQRIAGTFTLAAAMALSAGGTVALAADPPKIDDPGAAAAGWIAAQVESGVGPGSLADAIFAYAATGTGAGAAADALRRLEKGVDDYIYDGSAAPLPGNLAKTLLAVQVGGGDPNSFGGHDLEAELRDLLNTTPGPDLGRFGSASNPDQALAVLALARTSDGIPSGAVTWLVAAQCPSGDFQWDGSCPGPGSEDPDTTAFALQALLAGGASAAAATSTQLLLDIQGGDGSFSSYGTPNTNSTGVAGQALRAAGRSAEADAAAAFIVSLQYGCTSPASDRGAIPWAASSPGFLIYSTPQAVLALGAASLDRLALDGAAEAAPRLDCPAPQPTDPPPGSGSESGSGPTITLPPTDGEVAPAAGDPATTSPLAPLLLVGGIGGLLFDRAPARKVPLVTVDRHSA